MEESVVTGSSTVNMEHHLLGIYFSFLFFSFPSDGNELGGTGRQHQLHLNVTEVGTDRSSAHTGGQSLQLFGPNIQSRHCVIAHTEGIVTVTPCSRDAHTFVNGQRIYETTILQVLGTVYLFLYILYCIVSVF